ncbi:unnamed protein product, partial [Didymodactylos carnosus]
CPALIEYRRVLMGHLIDKHLLPNQCHVPRTFRARVNQLLPQNEPIQGSFLTFKTQKEEQISQSNEVQAPMPSTRTFSSVVKQAPFAPALFANRSVDPSRNSFVDFAYISKQLQDIAHNSRSALANLAKDIQTISVSVQTNQIQIDQIAQVLSTIVVPTICQLSSTIAKAITNPTPLTETDLSCLTNARHSLSDAISKLNSYFVNLSNVVSPVAQLCSRNGSLLSKPILCSPSTCRATTGSRSNNTSSWT